MAAALSLLAVAGAMVLVTKGATVALVHTGLGYEAARFLARSTLCGVGVPSPEAGDAARHPVRRRIVLALMLFGNVSMVLLVATAVLAVSGSDGSSLSGRVLTIATGLLVLFGLAWSPHINRALFRVISLGLRRWTPLERRDAGTLLCLPGEYAVKELAVEEGDWLVDRPLGVLRLSDEGVVLLGIDRATGAWVGAPREDTIVRAGDLLVLYGRERSLAQLDRRRDGGFGDQEHLAAVEELRRVRQREAERERLLELRVARRRRSTLVPNEASPRHDA